MYAYKMDNAGTDFQVENYGPSDYFNEPNCPLNQSVNS